MNMGEAFSEPLPLLSKKPYTERKSKFTDEPRDFDGFAKPSE
jgi:hypothetical protein